MGQMRSRSWATAFLTLGVLVTAAEPSRAASELVVAAARLHTPPDSHEPQRALVDLRNTGPEALTQVTVLCTFTGAGGTVLDTQPAAVPSIAAGAAASAEAVYYGWPRASGVACHPGPRP
jgi:hypothetical protein